MGKLRARRSHVMNAFVEHHAPSIQFGYRCFDRLLLNGLIQPFQQPERVIGFFNAYRGGQRVTRDLLRDVAAQFHHWVTTRVRHWGAPLLDAPEGRRDDFVAPYFQRAQPDQIVVILKARERQHAGCQHRLFFAQVEYCDNLLFHRRAALDGLGQRLLDANRTIGQPNKIATIFGRKVTRRYRGELKTVIEDLDLPNPVIRSHYRHGFIKQYVRDHLLLRTEPATNNVADYGVPKAVEHLPRLRERMASIIDQYLNVQQDILETFVDRGQLRALAAPTLLPNGKRIPGLKLDHPRQLALMHALVRFAHIAARGTFTTADLHPHTVDALGASGATYRLASLRYDLSKLRAKALVEKLPHTRSYRLTKTGYSICLVFLKLFERIYAPLTAGLLRPVAGAAALPPSKRSQLDRLYQRIVDDVHQLFHAVGLKIAA